MKVPVGLCDDVRGLGGIRHGWLKTTVFVLKRLAIRI
jgi:hypothetical protein